VIVQLAEVYGLPMFLSDLSLITQEGGVKHTFCWEKWTEQTNARRGEEIPVEIRQAQGTAG
jgi:hypothetical protein